MRTFHRFTGMLVAGALAAAALTGCGQAPWEQDAGGEASASPTAVPTPVPNDLSGGTTQREVVAGSVTATVDYWSTLPMDEWTPAALKPVSISMTTTVQPADGQKVYLQRAAVTVVPSTPAGPQEPLETQVDAATVSPGYLVLTPYTYSQTFTVGALPEGTTSVTLQFRYDFLVQSTPTSGDYAKQTATDALTVALAG